MVDPAVAVRTPECSKPPFAAWLFHTKPRPDHVSVYARAPYVNDDVRTSAYFEGLRLGIAGDPRCPFRRGTGDSLRDADSNPLSWFLSFNIDPRRPTLT